MITLPIKKQWYDMILSGDKKEEYREIKPYYTTRFINNGLLKEDIDSDTGSVSIVPRNVGIVRFRNGYSDRSPSFKAICDITIGTGNIDWGAVPGEKYYVLHILSIE
jgi:hypothetical protein